MRPVVVGAIRLYQATLSPLLFRGLCRHLPTCSQFAVEAVSRYGVVRGLWMTAGRLSRCRPLGTAGYDPVP